MMILALQLAAIAVGCAFFTWLVMHWALVPWRRSAGQHWAERARLLWTARRTAVWCALACASLGMFTVWKWAGDLPPYVTIPVLVAGLMLGCFPYSREIEPRYTFGTWARQTAWQLVVQFGLIGIGIGLLVSMPDVMDAAAWGRVAAGFGISALILSGAWLPLVMRAKHSSADLTSMQERLERITAEAGQVSGVRPRHIWLARTPIPNAAALPFVKAVLFTTRAMEVLDDDECRAIMLHEMEHLTEPLSVRLTRLFGAMGFLTFVFVNPVLHAWGGLGVAGLFAVFVILQRLINLLRRCMEHRADHAAIGGAGETSPVYARALEKLYEAGQLPAVMPGKSMVHPHLYDRMVQAGVTPDFPRPAAPARFSRPGLLCLALAATGYVMLLWP